MKIVIRKFNRWEKLLFRIQKKNPKNIIMAWFVKRDEIIVNPECEGSHYFPNIVYSFSHEAIHETLLRTVSHTASRRFDIIAEDYMYAYIF